MKHLNKVTDWKDGDKITITKGKFTGYLATLIEFCHHGIGDFEVWEFVVYKWDNPNITKTFYTPFETLHLFMDASCFTDGWMDEEHRLQLNKLWNK
jgi:hypothetical protein